jgi:hypothetical protein
MKYLEKENININLKEIIIKRYNISAKDVSQVFI